MTPAIISLLITLVCIVLFLWRPIPNAVTGCLGCAALVIFGVCPIDKAFSGFSNSTVILMFSMMIVGIAMFDTGMAHIVGNFVVKLSRGNERIFILSAGIASALLSSFLSNTAVIAMFLPIIASVSNSSDKMNIKNMTLSVTMGAMFGGVCTLVGSTPQLTANGILNEMTGQSLQIFDYLAVGAILTTVYIIYVQLIGYHLGKRIWGNETSVGTDTNKSALAATSEASAKTDDANPNGKSRPKQIILLVIFTFTIVFFIGGWISNALTAAIAALLCIITGCTNQKTVIKKMDWSVVFLLASCLGLASGLTNSGAGELLASYAEGVIAANNNPLILFGIVVTLTMIISNFITNSTAVVITLPIALAMCQAYNFNSLAFTLGIVYAANLSFCTPLANAQTAMTLVHGYKFSDYIKYNGILELLVLATIIIFVPIICPLV